MSRVTHVPSGTRGTHVTDEHEQPSLHLILNGFPFARVNFTALDGNWLCLNLFQLPQIFWLAAWNEYFKGHLIQFATLHSFYLLPSTLSFLLFLCNYICITKKYYFFGLSNV